MSPEKLNNETRIKSARLKNKNNLNQGNALNY